MGLNDRSIKRIKMTDRFQSLRQQPQMARVGMKWLPTEDQQLMEEVAEKKSLEEIASLHQRTQRSIKFRIIYVGLKRYRDLSAQQLAQKLNLTVEDLQEYIDSQEQKQRQHEERTKDRGISLRDLYDVMVEIRDLLRTGGRVANP